MSFSVYTVAFNARSFVGVARDPETALQLAVEDAARERPWTFLGKEIKALGDYTTEVIERPSFAGALTTKDAIVAAQRELYPGNDEHYDNLLPYSLVDDQFPKCEKNNAATEIPHGLLIKSFVSEEASAEFQRLFLRDLPFEDVESSLPDFLLSVFGYYCVKYRNCVSHAMVYNRKTRRVVIKIPGGREEIKMSEFLDRVVPWFVDALIDALYIAISEGHADAYEALRKLFVVVAESALTKPKTLVTVADIIKKSATNFEALKKRGMIGDYTVIRKTFDECLREDRDMTRIHEKMRFLYPKGHPSAPNTQLYLKKLNKYRKELHQPFPGMPDGDWFKALVPQKKK